MPDNTLNRTAQGWPYLDNDNYLYGTVPAYTFDLATKLQNGDAQVSAAINAANTVETRLAAVPRAQAAGVQVCAASGTSAPASINVPFPAGRFAVAPSITLTVDTTNLKVFVRAINRATTGFSIYIGNSDGTALTGNFTVCWHAIQMTSSAVSG